jgi:hypothetical protein
VSPYGPYIADSIAGDGPDPSGLYVRASFAHGRIVPVAGAVVVTVNVTGLPVAATQSMSDKLENNSLV